MNKIHKGNSLEILRQMPDNLVDCIVTSPPYYLLRSYLPKDHKDKKLELGLEETPEEYIKRLCDVFEEAKRVLKPTGTLWVNISDTYSTKSGSGFLNDNIGSMKHTLKTGITEANELRGGLKIPSKSLIGIPFRFALEMMRRGFILRNSIIWFKKNCMPSSSKDRFTVDFEYIFFFVKSNKYYFETQYEPYADATINDARFGRTDLNITTVKKGYEEAGAQNPIEMKKRIFGKGLQLGRRKRCVWEVTTGGSKVEHYAYFPESLIDIPIKSGCPEEVCKKCGLPKEKIYEMEQTSEVKNIDSNTKYKSFEEEATVRQGFTSKIKWKPPVIKSIKYNHCNCGVGFKPGVVLDPFVGSGTSAVVALKQKKNFIGIELNQDFIDIANKRVKPFLEQKRIGDFK